MIVLLMILLLAVLALASMGAAAWVVLLIWLCIGCISSVALAIIKARQNERRWGRRGGPSDDRRPANIGSSQEEPK